MRRIYVSLPKNDNSVTHKETPVSHLGNRKGRTVCASRLLQLCNLNDNSRRSGRQTDQLAEDRQSV